jgi:excisionase family DNA binding protein
MSFVASRSKTSRIDAAQTKDSGFAFSGGSPPPTITPRVKDVLITSEAAKYIGVSKKTLLKYCHKHHITFMRYPDGSFRFRKIALDQFMARCTIQGEKAA